MKSLLILATVAGYLLITTGCNNGVTTSASTSQNDMLNRAPDDSSSEDVINGDASEPK